MDRKSDTISQSVVPLFLHLFGGEGPNFSFEEDWDGDVLETQRSIPTDIMTWSSFALMLGLSATELAEVFRTLDREKFGGTLFSRRSKAIKSLKHINAIELEALSSILEREICDAVLDDLHSEVSNTLNFTNIKDDERRLLRIAEQQLKMADLHIQVCGDPYACTNIVELPYYRDLPKKAFRRFGVFKVITNNPRAGALAFQYCKVINGIPHELLIPTELVGIDIMSIRSKTHAH